MKTKIALVTGASRGLGYEFCRQLGMDACSIILTARNEENGLAAAAALSKEGIDVHFRMLDVSSEESMASLAKNLKADFGHIDLLVNNAGINSKSKGTEMGFIKNFKLTELDPEHMIEMIRINSIAPILMVKHLLPFLILSRNPKIVNVSSWLGSISQKTNGGNYSYCGSKALLNMYSRAMAFDVVREGVTAITVNPGWVQTEMGGVRAKLTPEESVAGILKVVKGLNVKDAGKFFQWDGSEHPW